MTGRAVDPLLAALAKRGAKVEQVDEITWRVDQCPRCGRPLTVREVLWNDGRLRARLDCFCREHELTRDLGIRDRDLYGYGASNGAGPRRRPGHRSAPGPEVDAPDIRPVLDDIAGFVGRYVVLPGDAERTALALWIVHSWAIDGAHATPYLLVTSPEKRTGKTRLLEVVELLVARPWRSTSASEAALFRKIAQSKPTLLLDEVDAIFGSVSDRTEPLRAVLNSGNRPGAAVARCVGDGANQTVADFSVYCAKVLAGIDTGRLPDTITDRGVPVAMKRKAAGETVRRFRHRTALAEAEPIREALERWADAHEDGLRHADPQVPEDLDDRAGEAWEPLLAIADLAGGHWPADAREAALTLSAGADEETSRGAQLLAALQTAFRDRETMGTAGLLEAVNADEDLPFGGWRDGRGLDARLLARLLKPYKIKPRTVRLPDGSTPKGYHRDQLADAWRRYLPQAPQPPQPPQPNADGDCDVADVADVAAQDGRAAGDAAADLGTDAADDADLDRQRALVEDRDPEGA